MSGAGSAQAYTGEYERGSTVVKVSADSDALRLRIPATRGAPAQDLRLTPIGPDTFLEQQFAQISHIVHGTDRAPARLLWGGYAYERRAASASAAGDR
jgi:hypothetical protein